MFLRIILPLFLCFFAFSHLLAQPGKDCNDPFVVNSLPFQQAGMTTEGFGDDYATSPCGDSFMEGDDFVITYTPVAEEKVTILLENVDEWTGLHVLTACPDVATECIANSLNPLVGNRLIADLLLVGGTTYYIIVSTFPDPQFTPFDLTILSGGIPNPGTSCANPLNITSLPFTDINQNTADFGNVYSGSGPCQMDNYLNGNELIYTYTPNTNEAIGIAMTDLSDFFAGIHIFDACLDTNPNCIGSVINSSTKDDLYLENVFLEAGTTYFIVVSTFENPLSVAFDLLIFSQQKCEAPSVVTFENISENSAVAKWEGNALYWGLEWVKSGLSPMGIGQRSDANIRTLDNLNPETDYDLYIQSFCAPASLMITGIYDGPLSGGTPKGVELYALHDIDNLSEYSIGSANNGDGSDGEEFKFPPRAVAAGSFLYWTSDTLLFNDFFGFDPDFVSTAALINGNDAVELFLEGTVIDQFGFVDVDGIGEVWEYKDGWASRQSGQRNNNGAFQPVKWTYSGVDQLEGGTTNATCDVPLPLATFSGAATIPSQWAGPFSFRTRPEPPACDGFFVDEGGFSGNYFGNRRDSMTICPDNADDIVAVTFNLFEVQNDGLNCLDALYIYDGENTNGNLIASPAGNTEAWCWDESAAMEKGSGNLQGMTVRATTTSGCLTFIFASNSTVELAGWEASVLCEMRRECAAPNNLNVVEVSNNYAELSWQSIAMNSVETTISWGLQGITPDAGTQVMATSNPFLLDALQATTTYDFYVRENCGQDGESTWTGPFTFSTLACSITGDSPDNATPIDTLPYSLFTSNADCYTDQMGEMSADVFFSITIPDCVYFLEASTCSALTDFDTYLYLLDEMGNILAFNDESPEGTCDLTLNGENRFSVLEVPVEPGEKYWIVVEGFGPIEGNFELIVKQSDRSPIEISWIEGLVSCYDGSDGSIDLELNGGAMPYTLNWSNGETNDFLENLTAGMYSVSVEDACGNTSTASIEVSQPDSIKITTSAFPADPNQTNGHISASASGGNPPYQFIWDDGTITSTLADVGTGTYCVMVTDSKGCTAIACGEVPLNTGVKTIAALESFQLFPNPASEEIFLQLAFEEAQDLQIEITDLAGRICLEKKAEKVLEKTEKIRLTNWPAGIYFVKIKVGINLATQRLVVLK